MRESQRIEQQRRALGAELAACRRAAGYSQATLASLVAYSRSTIANVETGRQHVPRRFWAHADEALRAGGVLAAANDQVEAAARRERQEAAHAARAARQARAARWSPQPAAGGEHQHAGAGWVDALGPAQAAAASLWSGSPDGRDLADENAEKATVVAFRWLIAPPDLSIARVEGWRPVSSRDLTRLRRVRQCLKDIDNAHGGGAALPMAMSYVRREIPQLLDGRFDDVAGRGLFAVVAEFQHDVGFLSAEPMFA